MIPVIVAVTRDAMRNLLSNEQLVDRFGVLALTRWEFDREYRSLPAPIERMMPLVEPSRLAGRERTPRIYDLYRKTIGSTPAVVRTASVKALRKGQQRITIETARGMPLKG